MMAHILDCYAALCATQQWRVYNKPFNRKPSKSDANTQQAKNKVFKTAMSMMSTGLTYDGAESSEFDNAFSKMLTTNHHPDQYTVSVFPDDSKQSDGRGWMPLHWAAIAFDTAEGDLHGLTEEDVRLVYASDPLALQRYHKYNEVNVDGEDVEGNCTGIQRYTPTHFLCMQPMTKKRTSLLRYFSICNRQTVFIPSILHVTCELGQPTEELLQFLLQLDSSQTSKFYFGEVGAYTPLGLLCLNRDCYDGRITCLLDVDSSADVTTDGFMACIQLNCPIDLLGKFEIFSKYVDWDGEESSLVNQLLHSFLRQSGLIRTSSLHCIDVIKKFLTIRPNAIKETYNGCLPVHVAARNQHKEIMEFLLNLYPESARIVTANERSPDWSDDASNNLLHLAAEHHEKVKYLCSRYPEMIHQRNSCGKTPLHVSLGRSTYDLSPAKILLEVGGYEILRTPVIHPTATNYSYNGWLPLHCLLASTIRPFSPISKKADFLRLLLRWYPEAAGISPGRHGYRDAPYQMAVDNDFEPYLLRLLLRAAPHVHPSELHRLNLAERRMAMFLAFRAAASDPTPLLMARLRFENKDLVKHVVSFL